MTDLKQVRKDLIKGMQEVFPKFQFKRNDSFQSNVVKLQEKNFRLKKQYIGRAAPFALWNTSLTHKNDTMPLSRIKGIIELWIKRSPSTYRLFTANSFDVATALSGSKERYHILIYVYEDKEFDLKSDSDIIKQKTKEIAMLKDKLNELEVKIKSLQDENTQLKKDYQSHDSKETETESFIDKLLALFK